MGETQVERGLLSEAPAWLQGVLYGLLAAACVTGVVLGVVECLWFLFPEIFDDAAGVVAAAVVFAVSFVWFTVLCTRRIRILGLYIEALANARGQALKVVRRRVWSSRGPAWRTLGLTPVFMLTLLLVPLLIILLVEAQSDFDIGGGADRVAVLLAAVALCAVVGWGVRRTLRKSEVVTLLVRASRQSALAVEYVDEAVRITPSEYTRPDSFWIGLALFGTFCGVRVLGDLGDALSLSAVWSSALYVVLSCAVGYFAISAARRQGAPTSVWLGVAAYPILAAAISALVYFSVLDTIAYLAAQGEPSSYPYPPGEFFEGLGWTVLTQLPMVACAWIASNRSPHVPCR